MATKQKPLSKLKRKTTRRNPPGTCALLVWGIPKDLKKQFRIRCMERGVYAKEVFVRLMEEFVR